MRARCVASLRSAVALTSAQIVLVGSMSGDIVNVPQPQTPVRSPVRSGQGQLTATRSTTHRKPVRLIAGDADQD